MKCGKCGSEELRHKSHDMHSINHSAAHGVFHGMRHGHPGIALLAGLGWLACKALDLMSDTWTCKACGHRFS